MTTATTDMRAGLVELTAERDALRAQVAGDLAQATTGIRIHPEGYYQDAT